jgi:hypothetical protein
VLAVAVAVIVAGTGLAGAATGGNFILGRANYESSKASLSNSAGIPLKLSAPSGVAPLQVSGKALVHNLNVQYVGGLDATALQATGGDGYTAPRTDIAIDTAGELVAATGALPAGTYYVNATAYMYVAAGNVGANCQLFTGSSIGWNIYFAQGGNDSQVGWIQAAETTAVAVTAGDDLEEWCGTDSPGLSGSYVFNAGITAIRVRSSSGTPAATCPPCGSSPRSRPRAHQMRAIERSMR